VTTLTAPRPAAPEPDLVAPPPEERRRIPRWALVLAIVVGWVVVWSFTKGQNTLVLAGREHTDLHESLTEFRDAVLASRDTNPVIQFTYAVGAWFVDAVDWLGGSVSPPSPPGSVTRSPTRGSRCWSPSPSSRSAPSATGPTRSTC
jgi:glycine betaine/proline transport system permease protein